MPPEGVARCRAAWARFVGSLTCVVHGNPTNPDNVRVTANLVALVDRDESHVDVPNLDLRFPTTLPVSARERMRPPRKRRPRGGCRRLLGRRVRCAAACRSSSDLSRGSEPKTASAVMSMLCETAKVGSPMVEMGHHCWSALIIRVDVNW